MAYGNRSAHEARRLRAGRPTVASRRSAAAFAISAFLALAVCSACGTESAFSRALGGIDEALRAKVPRRLDAAFERAYRRASSSTDWLSILKRARTSEAAGDSGRLLVAARRARRAMPASEPVAAAAAYAMIRGGAPDAAFGLFRSVLSPDARPALWAEAFLTSARSGRFASVDPSPDDFARLAEFSGDARPYAAAAVLALSSGDPARAASWAERAVLGGVDLPASLLWDCGLFEALAARDDASASATDLSIMGDAAWIAGDPDLARSRWESAIASNPKASWKPYAKLAYSSGERDRAESYWRRMRAAFLDGGRRSAGAAVAYASALAASGRDAEALATLAPLSSDTAASALALRVSAKAWPEGRLAAEAHRFAERGSGEAVGFALAVLAQRGLVDDMLVLFDSAEAMGLSYPDRWFYSAAASAARGDYAACLAAIEGGGPTANGPEASLASGLARRAMGDAGEAAIAFRAAAAASGDPAARCVALKQLGGTLGDMGDAKGAAAAYRAAAAADPTDSEASLLARRALAP